MPSSLEQIHAAIPHREPFLLVDEIVEQEEARIVCRKRFSGEEDFFAGHFPEFPVVPGVLLCEAAMQAGAILLSRLVAEADGGVPVATRIVLRLPLAANTIIWVFLVGYRASRAQNQKNTNDKQHRHATANRRDVCPPFPCVRFASGSGVCRREARRR